MSGQKQSHSFSPSATRRVAGNCWQAHTEQSHQGEVRGQHQSVPDEYHCWLTQKEARASLGLAIPAPHDYLLLRVNIQDDNCGTIGKGILSGFYFLHGDFLQRQRESLLTISFNAILAFLWREGEKGALVEGKARSQVPAASQAQL